MTIDIKLPDLGDGIDSGDVLDVLVQEGDDIAIDQGVVELETDKATVEVPSTHAGTVVKVYVRAGQSVAIGDSLLSLEATASTVSAAVGATERDKPRKSSAAAAPAVPSAAPVIASASTTAEQPVAVESTKPPTEAGNIDHESDGVAAGPAIRRFAREVGVNLARVTGTGEGGRITREDVLSVVREANQATHADTSFAATESLSATGEQNQWGLVRYDRLTKIRKTIASRMHESWSTIPRVTNFDDADVTQLEAMRQSAKDDYADVGIKLTTMPFVIKSVAMALRNHPDINASLDLENERIVYKEYIHIGIAVDTDRGLMVPSIRSADRLSIPDTARHLAAVADKVRGRNVSVDDLRGSTFTISNLGAVGGQYSTPIINPPEVAILLVGRARKQPVVIDDEVQIRLVMPLSLSYDHRIVDGAVAARFLNEVIGYLESPSRTLLAP